MKLPGLPPASDAVVDNDGVQDSLPRVLSGTQDPNPFFGRVVYTAGLTLDQPLALTRYGYTDYATATTSYVKFPPVTVSLMWTALGKVGLAACADGKAQCTATNGVGRTASMVLSVPDLWFLYERPKYVPVSWHGNVLDDQQTATGTHYRRNRYYDPGAGRFTQEDPIGLAGGLNLYGFAGSNPANFADPFGLCPIEKPLCHWIKATLIAAGTDIGTGLGGGAGFFTGPGAIVASPLGAIAGAGVGAAAGVLAGEIVDQIFFSKKVSSAGQMQREVERGRAPREVDRVDRGNPNDPGDIEPHVHLQGGRALTQSGRWKHGEGDISKVVAEWLKNHGWGIPR